MVPARRRRARERHVIHYIENQREHHRKKAFQEEYRNFSEITGGMRRALFVWDESIVADATRVKWLLTLSRP
ncbi:MAG: hypothetical protein DMG05_24070 [Acidobacteria bacterium]|nr:MAG: hypothetical protein DMG05_24070 [Acidobacteriota bacterium]